jgi:hypothetical protein
LIRTIAAFIIGGAGGFLLCAIFTVDSYQKGYEDGLRKGQKNEY